MNKMLFIIWKKIKFHKKKSTFLLVLATLYYFGKKGFLTKLLQKIMNIGILMLKRKIRKQNEENQKKLKKIKKNQMFIIIYQKVLQKSASEFGQFVNQHFDTEKITNKISNENNKKEKLKLFKGLNKLIMKKLIFSLLAQIFFDFKNFYLLVIFFNNYKVLYNKEIDLEDKETQEKLEEDYFNNKNNDFENLKKLVNDFIFKIMKDLIILNEKSILVNLEDKLINFYKLRGEICLQDFVDIIKQELDNFLSLENKNISKNYSEINFESNDKNVKLVKNKKTLFFKFKKYIFTNKTKKSDSLFTNLLKKFSSFKLQSFLEKKKKTRIKNKREFQQFFRFTNKYLFL